MHGAPQMSSHAFSTFVPVGRDSMNRTVRAAVNPPSDIFDRKGRRVDLAMYQRDGSLPLRYQDATPGYSGACHLPAAKPTKLADTRVPRNSDLLPRTLVKPDSTAPFALYSGSRPSVQYSHHPLGKSSSTPHLNKGSSLNAAARSIAGLSATGSMAALEACRVATPMRNEFPKP
mmetsp:Transcript_4298/g.6570  ORF Transcript_4298/g.6570 Transcript_4298/m.6570 type:complete len:174 (-) Transcript_4298:148-669(-)